MARSAEEPVLSASAASVSKLLGLPSLDETYGALLLGAFAGLLSYGILVNQAYQYMQHTRRRKSESWVNKAFVFSILALDTFDNAVILHACYTYLVTDYFQPLALLRGIWSIKVLPMMAGLTVIVCQSFFARRVYLFGKQYRVIVVISVLLMLTMFGFAVSGSVIAFKYQTYAEYEHFYWIDAAACSASIISDSLTAAVLVMALKRTRTPYKRTNTLLNTLIVYAINTGILTGIVNTLALVFALAQPDTMIWIAVEFVAVRIYGNSVLAVLNSRQSLREIANNSSPMDLELELQSARQTDGSSQDRSGFDDAPQKSSFGWLSDSVTQFTRASSS